MALAIDINVLCWIIKELSKMRKNDKIAESQLSLQFECVINWLKYFNKEQRRNEKKKGQVKSRVEDGGDAKLMADRLASLGGGKLLGHKNPLGRGN